MSKLFWWTVWKKSTKHFYYLKKEKNLYVIVCTIFKRENENEMLRQSKIGFYTKKKLKLEFTLNDTRTQLEARLELDYKWIWIFFFVY